MDDLNQSTNRLRRKFDSTANYLETKVQMEQVMDSARKVNQVVGKGSNDGQAQAYGRLCARVSTTWRAPTT